MLQKIKVLLSITITALVLPSIAATAPCDVECERNKLRYLERECQKNRNALYDVRRKILPNCEAKLAKRERRIEELHESIRGCKRSGERGGKAWNEAYNAVVQQVRNSLRGVRSPAK